VTSVEALRAYYDEDAANDAREAAASASSGRRLLLAFCAAGLAFAVVAAWLITRSIVRPLDEAVAAVACVARGDLTAEPRAGGRDEFARLADGVATMTTNLRSLVAEVVVGARNVADTSAQIAGGNGDLSQRTEAQATMLQETATSMEEFTSIVSQNAQNAANANALADAARRLALDGGTAVGGVVTTMNAIEASSARISDITGLIDSIAFQTNILALNAAVEAARAGSQGRGFAVVATEVRALAQRSAQAAREIKSLLDESAHQVETGARQAEAAGSKMQEIVAAVAQVSTLFADIAAAGAEQSAGIEQVNTAVVQMDQVVQENAALVEEAAAATSALSANASALLERVHWFRVDTAASTLARRSDTTAPWAAQRALAHPS
jgi:methyl-accepting chemotaxis protein